MKASKELIENYIKSSLNEELSQELGRGDDFRGHVLTLSDSQGNFKFEFTLSGGNIYRYVAEPDKPIRTLERNEVFTGTVTYVSRHNMFRFIIDMPDFRGIEFTATELWTR